MLTYLGDLGGLFEIALSLGSLFTSFVVGRMFNASLIDSVYRTQSTETAALGMAAKQDRLGGRHLRGTMVKMITAQQRLSYKLLDLIKHYACCHGMRSKQRLRMHTSSKKELFYRKGTQQLEQDLDIASFIKLKKRVDALLTVLLSKNQRFLLKFQQSSIIDSDVDSRDSDAQHSDELLSPLFLPEN